MRLGTARQSPTACILMGYRANQFGFTKPLGSKNVLGQGSGLTTFVIEGDSFRMYLCM